MICKVQQEELHDDLRLILEGARGSVCPFDQKKFSSSESLHRHLHAAHLDTGSDSLDCPLGQDSLHCFCGRETNCRHSLVIHVSRCGLNNSAEGMRSHVVVDDPEAGSLATMRKAARRCRELGIKDRPSQEDAKGQTSRSSGDHGLNGCYFPNSIFLNIPVLE